MKKSQLKIGVILSYIGMFTQNLISIVYTPVMLRLLGQSEYGLYQLVFSVISYLGLMSFGFSSSYVRFYSRYKVNDDEDKIAKLNGMFIIIFIFISIITLICGTFMTINAEVLFSDSLSISEIQTARILMFFMIINLSITFVSSVFDNIVTAHEKYFFQKILSLVQIIANPFLTLPLLLMGYKSISLVIATTLITLIKFIVNVFYCKKNLNVKFSYKKFDKYVFIELGTFSFYIFLNMIVDQINWSVDKYVLGIFNGTVAVAIYSIGSQINSIYMNASSSISSVFIPRINVIVAENCSANEKLTNLFIKVGRIQFIILSLIYTAFVLLGQYFISVWAGNQYSNAYYVAVILITPVTIPLIQNIGIEIQRSKNMHKFRSIVYFIVAILNITISIPLSKYFSEIGAAIGTAVSLLIGNVIIMNWYYNNRVGLDISLFWKNIFKLCCPVLVSFFIGIILKRVIIIDCLINFILYGIIYTIIYIFLMYLLGMNDEEKKLLTNLIHKIIKRKI